MASARAASPRQADVDYDVFAEGAYSLDVGGLIHVLPEFFGLYVAAEPTSILDAHPGLPLITWAVGPAGSSLAGRVTGPVPGVGAAFTAWQQALGLDDVIEVPAGGGSAVWLRARARRGDVRVTVTATVITGETAAS